MNKIVFVTIVLFGLAAKAETFDGKEFNAFFKNGDTEGRTTDGHPCDLWLDVETDGSAALYLQDQSNPDTKDVQFTAPGGAKVESKSKTKDLLRYIVEIDDHDVFPATTTEHLDINSKDKIVTVKLTNYDVHLNWGHETLTCTFSGGF